MSQPFRRMSIARSGERICTVPRSVGPVVLDRRQKRFGVGGAKALDQGAGAGVAVGLADQEGQRDRLARAQGHAALQGGAGVKGGTGRARQRSRVEGRQVRQANRPAR